jgi:nucleotide-binding universal stress UspA family protein
MDAATPAAGEPVRANGLGAVRAGALGSVSGRLAQSSPCSVLVASAR